MGLAAAQSARIPVGKTPEESSKLLSQTSAAVAVPRPLDFSGIEDVSPIFDTAVAGGILSICELCSVKRTWAKARYLLQQLEETASQGDCSERLTLFGVGAECCFLCIDYVFICVNSKWRSMSHVVVMDSHEVSFK